MYLQVQLGQPWGEHAFACCLQCLWHNRLEQWVSNMSKTGGCNLAWLPTDVSAWGLPLGQGWLSLSPLAWGDLLFLLLRAEPPELPMVLSPQCTVLGDRGWGYGGSLLQPFQGPLEMQVDGCGDVTRRLHGIGKRGGSTSTVGGTWMSDVTLLGCMLPKSTSISCGLQAGSLGVAKWQFPEGKLQVHHWGYHYVLVLQ